MEAKKKKYKVYIEWETKVEAKDYNEAILEGVYDRDWETDIAFIMLLSQKIFSLNFNFLFKPQNSLQYPQLDIFLLNK